jgi:tetratricopeptide (TPR) repeat protein
MLINVQRPLLWRSTITLWLALSGCFCLSQPQDAATLMAQGNAAMRSGDVQTAVQDFTAFTKRQPGSAEGFFNLGLALQQSGRLEDSLAALHKAQALQPSLRGLRLFDGIVSYKLNRLSDAHELLQRATQSEPKNAATWMWLGIVELAQDDPESAASALDKAAQLDPKNLDILYHRGRAHLLVSKESYSAMFKLDPDSWRVHEVIGQSEAEAFRNDNAISELTLAVRSAPHEPGLHEQLGDLYWTIGKFQEAGEAYEAEIKIDPANAVVKYKLGSLQITRNEYASGVSILQQALAEDPGLSDIHYYLGKGDAALDKSGEAISEFRLATSNKNAEELRIMSWYQLAMLYRRMHRAQESADALTTFRQLKSARDIRQETKYQEQGKRRAQLPVDEEIPADAPPSQ